MINDSDPNNHYCYSFRMVVCPREQIIMCKNLRVSAVYKQWAITDHPVVAGQAGWKQGIGFSSALVEHLDKGSRLTRGRISRSGPCPRV